MVDIQPELIGAVATGLVTTTLAVIAALRQRKSPGREGLSHVDGLGTSEVMREIVISELRAEVVDLKRDLATCERRGILMIERLIAKDSGDS